MIEVLDKDGNVIYSDDKEEMRKRRMENFKNGVRTVGAVAGTIALNAIPIVILGYIVKVGVNLIRK